MPTGSSGAGGGGGYTIPISVSAAHSFSVPQNTAAPTIFNFGAGNVEGGEYENEQSPVQPVTATASTALGGNSNAAAQVGAGGQIDSKTLLIAGVAAAVVVGGLVAAAIFFSRR